MRVKLGRPEGYEISVPLLAIMFFSQQSPDNNRCLNRLINCFQFRLNATHGYGISKRTGIHLENSNFLIATIKNISALISALFLFPLLNPELFQSIIEQLIGIIMQHALLAHFQLRFSRMQQSRSSTGVTPTPRAHAHATPTHTGRRASGPPSRSRPPRCRRCTSRTRRGRPLAAGI